MTTPRWSDVVKSTQDCWFCDMDVDIDGLGLMVLALASLASADLRFIRCLQGRMSEIWVIVDGVMSISFLLGLGKLGG